MNVSRRRSRTGLTSILVAALAWPVAGCASGPDWEPLGTGLELARLPAGGEGEAPALTLLRLPAGSGARLRVRHSDEGLLASELRGEPEVLAAVNANYFDERGRVLGWAVSDGREISPIGRSGWGVLSVGEDGSVRIRRPAAVAASETAQQAVQAGPLLVEAGRPNPGLKEQSARRVFVGLDAKGRVVLGSTGLARAEARALSRVLARPAAEGGAGLVEALNLDGGSSAQLFARRRGDGGDLLEPGLARVPVLLTIEATGAAGD